MRNRVVSLVSNNIATDQRLIKVGSTLQKHGFDFELTGTLHISAPDISHIPFKTNRLGFVFKKNFFFYAELQLKFLLQLLRTDKSNSIILANDLDTLLPARMVSELYKIPLVVDFHEIFTEMPTLKDGSFQKKTWQFFQDRLVPGLRHTYTVSNAYAAYFREKYKIDPEVILNVPFASEPIVVEKKSDASIILYQGAMNFSRGIDKMIGAMEFLPGKELWLIGDGPYLGHYRQLAAQDAAKNNIRFLGSVLPDELKKITPMADLGLSLEEDKGLSYRYAAPNKIFDYIHAEIPVLGNSDLIEMKNLIEKYHIGDLITSQDPQHIAFKINDLLNRDKAEFLPGLQRAKKELNWQQQEQKLVQIFQNAANE